jgi:hypothetical protein
MIKIKFRSVERIGKSLTAMGKVDYFISFNKKDFAQHSLAQLHVHTPGEFLALFT